MTSWDFPNLLNGASWLAGQSDITAGQTIYDGKTLNAGGIGSQTSWTLQTKN